MPFSLRTISSRAVVCSGRSSQRSTELDEELGSAVILKAPVESDHMAPQANRGNSRLMWAAIQACVCASLAKATNFAVSCGTESSGRLGSTLGGGAFGCLLRNRQRSMSVLAYFPMHTLGLSVSGDRAPPVSVLPCCTRMKSTHDRVVLPFSSDQVVRGARRPPPTPGNKAPVAAPF